MFNVRLRLYKADASKGTVLSTLAFSTSIQESGVAGLTFTVSERVAGRLVAPFVVGVEFSTGGAYVQPRNGMFIVTEEAGDSADASKTFTFTGTAFVPWLIEGMHQRMNPYTGARYLGAKTEWPNATPGRILRSLIDHGKTVNGWAPMLTTDFTATADSAGVAWTAAEKWSPEFQRLTSIRDIFDAHVNSGLIDWWTEGTKLRVFRPGTGTIYPNVKLGGPGFSQMPVKQAYKDQFSFLTIIAEDGARYYSNPGADLTFGPRHMTATLSGVKLADADRIVQPMLLEGRTPQRELSYEWTPVEGMPVPWVDFQVGDGVTVRGRDGWTEQRVLGVTVAKSGTNLTVRVTVGSKLLNRLKRAMQKIEGGSLGQISGGTGVTVPAAPTAPVAAPKVPTGLRVVSNTATWGEDGSARTRIVLGWDAVTQAEDLSDVDGVTYEVAGRLASDASARLTATDALTFTVEGWEPDIARYVKVRALDRAGNVSAWSVEIAVTPVMPSSIVPKAPTGLAVASNTASFVSDGRAVATVTVGWSAVTQSVDNTPVTASEYELTAGGEVQRVTGLTGSFSVTSGLAVGVRVRALTSLGVWGDPSVVLTVTGASPSALTVIPSAPVLTTAQGIVFAAWSGTFTSGTTPAGFQHVLVELALAAGGPWKRVGVPIAAGGGGVNIKGTAGETVWVRFVPVDTLGRAGNPSASTSVVVKAVEVGDIDKAITDAIEKAQSDAKDAWDAASVAVVKTVPEWAVSSSETTAPTSGWSATAPVRTPGQFIWQRTAITYGNASTTTTPAFLVTGNTGAQGSQGVPGAPGSNGQPTYTWLKYATTPTTGMSDDPTGKAYMGLAMNKTTATESSVYADYQWSLVKGDQGVQGPKGADGAERFTWIKYADTPTTGMSDSPTNKTYMGIAYNKATSAESNSYADYEWSLIRGPQGSQGVQGPKGADGNPTYTWIKYGTSAAGAGLSDDPAGKTYIGIAYNKTTQSESSTPGDYEWSLIQGPQGNQGIPGAPGADGVTTYTWVKYATSAAGAGMSDDPAGKTYIGLAYNKTTQTESTTPGDYQWALIKGADGAQGVSVTAVAVYYQTTAAGAAAPAVPTVSTPPSPWTTTEPAYVTGTALWAVTRVGYSNSSFSYSPVSKVSAYTAAVQAGDKAAQAVADALTAKDAAVAAQSKADQADAAALAAAGIANSKGRVIYQASAPTGANANAQNLWIRTSDNKPHTFNGTAWVPVTDKAATDAATAASAAASAASVADGKAVAAQSKADQAAAAASAAQGTANTAVSNAATAQSKADAAKSAADAAQVDADALVARGTDLITNGDASMGSLNFSTWTVEVGDQPPGAAGAFYSGTSASTTRLLDDFVPVDPNKPVLASIWVKQATPGVTSRFYWGMIPCDIDGLAISVPHYNEQAGSRTTLAAPLSPGDTTVQVVSAAGWDNTGTTVYRYLAVWNYTDGKGKRWPAGSYTRLISGPWAAGAVTGNTVTLPVPWAGGSHPTGTPVGVTGTAGTYMYAPGLVNTLVPNEWTKLVATAPYTGIRPDGPGFATTAWPSATAKARVVILTNYGVSGGTSKQLFAGLSLSEANAAQLRAAEARTAADAAQATANAAQTAAGNAQTTANQAQATASGKSKTYRALTVPSGTGTAVEDTWEQWSSLTTGGKLLAFWRWTGTAWVKGTLDETYLPLVNIGAGTYGNLHGNRLQADTVIADEVIVPGTVGGTLIKDGAVSTSKLNATEIWANTAWIDQATVNVLRAGIIEVDMLSPSLGDSINLEANGSINLLVGRVDANSDALNEQQTTLGQQAADLAAAQAAADAAASGASAAGIAAAVAKAVADAAQAGVDKYGTVFEFEEDGLGISAPDSPISLKLSNANIAIRRDGVPQTIWTETEMIVPKLRADQVFVGKTVITKKSDGMTWQRL